MNIKLCYDSRVNYPLFSNPVIKLDYIPFYYWGHGTVIPLYSFSHKTLECGQKFWSMQTQNVPGGCTCVDFQYLSTQAHTYIHACTHPHEQTSIGRHERKQQTCLHIHWSNTDQLRCTNIKKRKCASKALALKGKPISISVNNRLWCLYEFMTRLLNWYFCIQCFEDESDMALLDEDKQMYSLLYYIHYLQIVQPNKSINAVAHLTYHNPDINWHQVVHFNPQATKK